MQIIHELGHVIGAIASGGRIAGIHLHPLDFSRTDQAVNPRPLITTWMGPLFGATFPAALWLVCSKMKSRALHLIRFFAGFCLVANGAYIGIGAFSRMADAGYLLRFGAPFWHCQWFGLLAMAAGFALWNGLAPAFGIGKSARSIPFREAALSAGLLTGLILAELLWGLTPWYTA